MVGPLRGLFQVAAGVVELVRARATDAADSLLAGASSVVSTPIAGKVGAFGEEVLAAARANRATLATIVREEVEKAVDAALAGPSADLERARATVADLAGDLSELRGHLLKAPTLRDATAVGMAGLSRAAALADQVVGGGKSSRGGDAGPESHWAAEPAADDWDAPSAEEGASRAGTPATPAKKSMAKTSAVAKRASTPVTKASPRTAAARRTSTTTSTTKKTTPSKRAVAPRTPRGTSAEKKTAEKKTADMQAAAKKAPAENTAVKKTATRKTATKKAATTKAATKRTPSS